MPDGTSPQDSRPSATTAAGPMPPYRVLRGFFAEATVERLLDFAIAKEAKFQATMLRNKIDPAARLSVSLTGHNPLMAEFESKISSLVPALIAALRITPFEIAQIKTELVAHGDGAFYKRHIDTFTGDAGENATQRMLSAVYYFHREPKGFSGGALRLYAFGAHDAVGHNFVDIEPERNALVVFPSWAPHEVRTVSCPSGRFADSRFAINCWFKRAKPADNRKTAS